MAGSDLFTGSLDLLILKAVSWGPMHGYAIGTGYVSGPPMCFPCRREPCIRVAPARREGAARGALGTSENRPGPKFYRLIPSGRRQLKAEAERWRAYSRVMANALAAERA
jgi:DNA-binding PadR family transcriptional regulator